MRPIPDTHAVSSAWEADPQSAVITINALIAFVSNTALLCRYSVRICSARTSTGTMLPERRLPGGAHFLPVVKRLITAAIDVRHETEPPWNRRQRPGSHWSD